MSSAKAPTVHDMVVLGALAERPRHGYELAGVLAGREEAAVSRPQVYYSLKKLAEAGWIVTTTGTGTALGPEREVYAVTPAGRETLARALAQETWATRRTSAPFVTWLALAAHAEPEDRRRVLAARRGFLRRALSQARAKLATMGAGPAVDRLSVGFTIRQLEVELVWLEEVAETLEGAS